MQDIVFEIMDKSPITKLVTDAIECIGRRCGFLVVVDPMLFDVGDPGNYHIAIPYQRGAYGQCDAGYDDGSFLCGHNLLSVLNRFNRGVDYR